MRLAAKAVLAILVVGLVGIPVWAQCPDRPAAGSVVQDALNLTPQNGVLSAEFTMAHSIDSFGYNHYCYKYAAPGGNVVEAPTIRVSPGNTLNLVVKNEITSDDAEKMGMKMDTPAGRCGDGGQMTIQSTNVHFHGLNVPPKCHQDDVINTLIQPGSDGFQYSMKIPMDEPPGLYWYHPHVHGFTEFQVNGGAAGALIVEGMENVRPEVAGLTERVFVIRQQYLVPWIPGPYQLTLNYEVSAFPQPLPVIQMKPGEKQFWRVANATLQDFMPLQVLVNGLPEQLQVVALDGYPLSQTRTEETILIPPAGRAEFIVTAPAAGSTASFIANAYSTGPTGNPDIAQTIANIQLTSDAKAGKVTPAGTQASSKDSLRSADLARQTATTQRKLYFSEEFGGTNGPIQFYITVDGQKQKVFEPNEKPVITTKVGAIEDWTIENRALETHAFHMHQIHFMVLEIDGKPVPNPDLRDTIEIPFWEGSGPYHSVKVRMDFRDPGIAGTFVFHCHILLHEDLGMMHKIEVDP